MKKTIPVESADAYVDGLAGWRRSLVEGLRKAVLSAGKLDEQIKWGHLVYLSNGPVLLIRAEEERVLFGFWRGKRLRELDDRLKASGKYELANIVFRQGDAITPARTKALVKAAVALNQTLGDPTAPASATGWLRS